MQELKEKGIIIQETTTEELRNDYINMIDTHLPYLKRLIETILSIYKIEINNINLESIVEKTLLTEIKYNGMYTIGNLNDELKENFKKILQKELTTQEELFNLYVNGIKEPIKRNQIDWIDKVIEDFLEQIIKNILKEENKQNIPTIIKELKKEFQEYKKKLFEEYNEIQTNFVEMNTTQIQELIYSIDIDKIKLSKYSKFQTLIDLCNYDLIIENNTLYIINKETKEKIEIKDEEDILKTKDNNIRFIIDKEKNMQGYIDEKIKRGLVIQPGKITFTKNDTNETITIIKTEKKYILKRNNETITNIKEIKRILREIRDYYPNVFKKILQDRDFLPILKSISLYNKIIENKIKNTNKLTEESNLNDTNINKRI